MIDLRGLEFGRRKEIVDEIREAAARGFFQMINFHDGPLHTYTLLQALTLTADSIGHLRAIYVRHKCKLSRII